MNGFFKEIKVEASENVPQDGPLLVCCTHWNMIVDVSRVAVFTLLGPSLVTDCTVVMISLVRCSATYIGPTAIPTLCSTNLCNTARYIIMLVPT